MSVNGIPLDRVKNKLECTDDEFKEVENILERYLVFNKMMELGITVLPDQVSYSDLDYFYIIKKVIEEHRARTHNGR